MKRHGRVYLKMKDAPQALRLLMARAGDLAAVPGEQVPTVEAAGRVTAEPVYARDSSPGFPAAAMDGYAVCSELTFSASEAEPVALSVPEQAEPVDTGDPLPEGKDAVHKIEDIIEAQGSITVMAAAWPGQHVRLVGEEAAAGDLLVTSGQRLDARHIGLLLAARVWSVCVRKRPVVTLIPTGEECVQVGQDPADGQLVEYNGPMLAAMLTEWGAEPRLLRPVADEPDELADVISRASDNSDMVVVIAGSSAGRDDLVPQVFSNFGELLVHGVQMMPGKPLALAWSSGGTPLIGLPGYCVAAWMAADRYARPIICHLLGLLQPRRQERRARVARNIPSGPGMLEVLRVALCDSADSGVPVAVPLARGSGAIASLAAAQALLHIQPEAEGLDAGTEVHVELLVSPEEIDHSVLMVGSHDLALALVADELARRQPPWRLLCISSGSTEGLTALGRGEGLVAGTHLLDPSTGQYNVNYLQRWLPELPLLLVNLAYREVGLLVAPGNPGSLRHVTDLARPDVTFINRQAGSGTRILLDALLAEHGMEARSVRGYEREAYTHTMVAEAIRRASADVGLGIRAAAEAFGLDFIPVTEERYDLVVPKTHLRHGGIAALLETLRAESLQRGIAALEGYSTRSTGEVLYEQ